MRRIAVVTVARSDYSILRPVMRSIDEHPELELVTVASGMHLSPAFGATSKDIEADGFQIDERIEMLFSSDTPVGTAKSIGAGVMGFADLFGRCKIDCLVLMGDRFEMFSAAVAALPFSIPVAHIHGGELSEGAFDDALRHSITKLSHYHFVATDEYRRRVVQLGEDPKRVLVTGAPALDNLKAFDPLSKEELESFVGIELNARPLVVTFHPTTLETDGTENDTDALLAAVSAFDMPIIITAPNADPGGAAIRARMLRFVSENPDKARFVENMGVRGYYSLLGEAVAMVGNSSSGIIEAASFGLPVVNVGNRQKGRVAGANVIHAPAEKSAIAAAVETALSADFRNRIAGLANVYGDGEASTRIVEALHRFAMGPGICMKPFHDLERRG